MSIKRVEVPEKELEDMIVSNPEAIEQGMRVYDHQISTDSGTLDILAVDKDGAVVVIELKVDEDDYMLFQALRYYSWVSDNLEALARMKPQSGLDPDREPRLMLVAPSFSEKLERVSRHVNPTPELMEGHVLEDSNGQRYAYLVPRDIPQPKYAPRVTKVEEHIQTVDDKDARRRLKILIARLEKIFEGTEVYATTTYIGFKYKGRLVVTLYPQKKAFWLGWRDSEGEWKEESWDEIETMIDEATLFYKSLQ